jgi:hypothetical protein
MRHTFQRTVENRNKLDLIRMVKVSTVRDDDLPPRTVLEVHW